ncbi:MAG: pyruvate dehydrogenase (acetyl-transferring), homodimeric type [Terriglobia bacterium]
MGNLLIKSPTELEELEVQEWIDSLDYVLQYEGHRQAERLLRRLLNRAARDGVQLKYDLVTPYINTIPADNEPTYPGNLELEARLETLIRWNAMAMVVRANRKEHGIGGHLASYAAQSTLFEVGLNHFLRGKNHECGGDMVYFQGHSSPGIYARAFLEGRLTAENLENFRRELSSPHGISSYPHPWLMPGFWEFPSVDMGLAPIMAIYQARFQRYLEDRGLKKASGQKVWALLGDGEMDEPESLGAITLAGREKLDNLIFVICCNLQRLDGPVRGNGNIVDELEGVFRGAGWNVIKVLWASDWDALFARDADGLLIERAGEIVDGERQRYAAESGAYFREHFFGKDPRLVELVKHLSDEELHRLRLGGHDPKKVYAAYREAVEHTGSPTVILARTIKGYGFGQAGEGKNIAHQQKNLEEDQLRAFSRRVGLLISDEQIAQAAFYKPPDDSLELQYLQERRRVLGGYLPSREVKAPRLTPLPDEVFNEFYRGTGEREISTTMAFVRILAKLLKDKEIGKLIVPIVPDEARTFGMEALFRQVGIYSHMGQLYEPADKSTLVYYREATDGQTLEEGITEAGSMADFIAAGTAYATHGVNTIPFFIFYSMFGFQRIGDLIWAAGDCRTRGFLLGGTAGRTTLLGEGLQHEDGNSHLLAYPVPNLLAYDPAFAHEIAVIIQDGIRRMYVERESIFYYLTLMNENYVMPAVADITEIRDGILRGMYKFRPADDPKAMLHAQLLSSGTIVNEALKAQRLLAEKYNVAADVWSVTSYKQLYRDGHDTDRWNMLHPAEAPRIPFVTQSLSGSPGVIVAASDYVKALPDSISRWCPRPVVALGTDGFGRSDNRAALRDFFEVDYRFMSFATLGALLREGQVRPEIVSQAAKELEINPEKLNPATT